MTVETSSKATEFHLFRTSELIENYGGILLPDIDSSLKNILSQWQSLFFGARQHGSEACIAQETSQTVLSDQSKDGWIAYIRTELYSISEVEAIYVTIEESNIDVWVLIPERDIRLVRQIADKETKILERFAGLEQQPKFLLDFHVVYRCGADELLLVPRRAIRLPI